ncbi:hypothetical protein HJC23_002993 [Cyclotella cryptica]|uniref:Uncharacterized protein n=1 Tax=Cyclotella cryptica TaxID=29204 RepID=A0ABD3PSC5_9STRA|eukprot:CCRYP_011802-RA/>CCRYP_011802-RA protein AED:0.19 eAED:0.19 QI:0/-1/0/1/-1/1/1/0/283
MAMKIYQYMAHRSNGRLVSTTSQKKKQRVVSGRAFGRFRKRKHHDANQGEKSKSPSANESVRKTELITKDSNKAQEELLNNDDVVSVFEQIDELVSSLMAKTSAVKEVKTKIKVHSVAEVNNSSILSRRKLIYQMNSKSKSSVQDADDPAAKNDSTSYTFQCFGCGELLENFTNNLASRELYHIQVEEDDAKSEDGSDMSALTDLTANLATDLIILPNSKTIYADNYRARKTGRKGFNMSIKDDLSYVSFGSIENADEIAVDALARDDISVSFLGRLDSLSEC